MATTFDPSFSSFPQWGGLAPVSSGSDFLKSLSSWGAPISPAMGTTNPLNLAATPQLNPTLAMGGNGGGNSMWSMDAFLGKRNPDGSGTMGWGGPALGGAQALASLWMGMKNYNLAKDTLAFQKESFGKNYGAQVATTNGRLEDRQASRVAADPTSYESVGSYMAKHGIKG